MQTLSLLVFERYWVYVCNKCHDLLTIAYSLKDIAILNGKGNYSIDKAAEYYKPNKEAIKEKAKERYKNLEEEKGEKDQISRVLKKHQELVQYKQEALINK